MVAMMAGSSVSVWEQCEAVYSKQTDQAGDPGMCNCHGSRSKGVWGNASHVHLKRHRNALVVPAGNGNQRATNAGQINDSTSFIVLFHYCPLPLPRPRPLANLTLCGINWSDDIREVKLSMTSTDGEAVVM
jgi:hypothetical protein